LAHVHFGVGREEIDGCLKEQSEKGCRIGEALRARGLLDREQTRFIIKTQARWTVAAAQSVGSPCEFPLATSLSLCMPAYNEAANIEDVLDAACAILPELVDDFEIVVVNDGSKDNTAEVLANYAQSESRLRVVTHPENRGYGAALTSALRASRGELACILDSDGQFSLLNMPELLMRTCDSDVVIGYRKKRADPPIRLFNAWAWNRLMRLLLGVSVRDLDCAFKLFRRETVQDLSLTSRGACISAEILVQCVRNRLKIAQVGVDHYPRSHGAPTGAALKVIGRAFGELPRLMKYRWSRKQRPLGPAASPVSESRVNGNGNGAKHVAGSGNGAMHLGNNGHGHELGNNGRGHDIVRVDPQRSI
jgi:hypothetical protein